MTHASRSRGESHDWNGVIRRLYVIVAACAVSLAASVSAAAQSVRPACLDGTGFVSTSYGPPWVGIQGTGVTATGVNLRGRVHPMYGVAVDPRVIPLGSTRRIWPNPFHYRGRFKAFDTGSAIKGNRIDFFDHRGRAHQNRWGKRPVRVCR